MAKLSLFFDGRSFEWAERSFAAVVEASRARECGSMWDFHPQFRVYFTRLLTEHDPTWLEPEAGSFGGMALMDITEAQIDRWLERGRKFFKTVARNPVVRGTLSARGLTDQELERGWQLYSDLHGFGDQAPPRAAVRETGAAQAINTIDAWDAPTYHAAHAVLDARYPEVAAFLFHNLEATTGVAAVAGVARFLDRIDALRDGKAANIDAKRCRAAVELLATRGIVDATQSAELRRSIETVQLGASPNEVSVSPEPDAHRRDVARLYIQWLNEWREVARVAIARRDYRISLGLAQRRQAGDEPTPAAQKTPKTRYA
ncbi:MAG TPA: hypothetical protein VIV60_37620 [Polyangiaceae bacterium]